MSAPTLVVPTAASIGAIAQEVADKLKSEGDIASVVAKAMFDALTQIYSDLTTLGGVADATIVHLTQTIAFGDFAALSNGVTTKDYTVSAALPTNAVLLAAVKATDFTGFDDNGGGGTATLVVGTSTGGNEIGTSLNVATGQTGFPKLFTAGATGFATASLSGAAVKIRIASNHDLNDFTAGSAIVHLFYFVLA